MIKDKNILLAIGMFSLATSILLGRFFDTSPTMSFLKGLFMGLAIVLNLFYLIKIGFKGSRKY